MDKKEATPIYDLADEYLHVPGLTGNVALDELKTQQRVSNKNMNHPNNKKMEEIVSPGRESNLFKVAFLYNSKQRSLFQFNLFSKN